MDFKRSQNQNKSTSSKDNKSDNSKKGDKGDEDGTNIPTSSNPKSITPRNAANCTHRRSESKRVLTLTALKHTDSRTARTLHQHGRNCSKSTTTNWLSINRAISLVMDKENESLMNTVDEVDDDRFRILTENTVEDTVLGDYDSDFNAIIKSTFKMSIRLCHSSFVNVFEQSLELQGAFKVENETFSAFMSTQLTIKMYLPDHKLSFESGI